MHEAVYSRGVTVPDSGQPQSTWIEFGAVNHQATWSVDGRVVATQTTAFTPSKFDVTAYAAPGTTHMISVAVKGRGALRNSAGKYLVPVAADWSEAVPQGIFRSAFLRTYPAVYVCDTCPWRTPVFAHCLDGTGQYGERVQTVPGRPDGEGEYIWPRCNTKQGFEWFATATAAQRGKGANDLRPYTLLSARAGVIPGVRSTDFTPEEGGHPIYGAGH